MKFLVTGFEPFGGAHTNPSQQVAQRLDGQRVAGARIVTCILPVDGHRGPAALLEALARHQPDAVLCLGVASGRAVISVERVAINLLDYRIPDNSGSQINDQPVIEGGPDAYFVTLPARQMYEAIRAAGVPCELSLSAGAYLCNQVLYHLLHAVQQLPGPIPAGFVHLPALPEETARQAANLPSMSLETTLTGVQAAIGAVVRSSQAAGGAQ